MSNIRRLTTLVLLLTACLGAAEPIRTDETRGGKSPVGVTPQAGNLRGLSLLFEPNVGQTGSQVRFLTRAAGMTAYLTDRENVMVLTRRRDRPGSKEPREIPGIEKQTVVRMKLEGARSPRFEGMEKAESISNYFIGNDPSKWRPNVPNYRKVRARGVYEGIDVVYYGDGRKLEYDFVVRPGADPRQIQLTYGGADSLTIDPQGNLVIATALGALVQWKPKVYQEFGGGRREVEASYAIRGGKVEFALANWDRKRDLVIDPVLVYSTYLGGSGLDYVYGIALDSSGAAYLAGTTNSPNFPVVNGSQLVLGGNTDAFIAKLNPSGSALVYSTYLGGAGPEEGNSIAVDSSGEAYITGMTFSTDFPTTSGAFQSANHGGPDAFVTKLSATGNALVYSTYLGGNDNDAGNGIAVDSSGQAYVTGYTFSSNFPTVSAFQSTRAAGDDVFVTKFNAAGSALVYSTFLGGDGNEVGNSIALDSSGEAYVTGVTASTNFPTVNPVQSGNGGGQDAFVTKFSAAGNVLVYSTYLGGSGSDTAYGVAVDSSGEAYVTGVTASTNFPALNAFQSTNAGGQDAFVTKFSAAGNPLVYSTYLGGSDNDISRAIALSADGSAYIGGTSFSVNFPVTACAFQTVRRGGQDAILTKLNPSGNALTYSTFVGGSAGSLGYPVAVDSAGAAYIGGYTHSSDFPTTPGAFQTAPASDTDAFVTKLDLTPPGAPFSIVPASGAAQSTAAGTYFGSVLTAQVTDVSGNPVNGVTVSFTASGSGASAILNPTTATTDCNGNASVTARANTVAGTYQVTATAAGLTTHFTLTNTPLAAETLSFTQQPTDTAAGNPISPVKVLVEDAYLNPVSGSTVAIAVEGGTATLHGTLTQTTDSTGHATFDNLSINTTGAYQLQATTNGLATISNSFLITAGSAVSIAVSAGDGQTAAAGNLFAAPLEAIVHDAHNNAVSGASVMFTAPASGAGATFAGSTTATVSTDANGIAISPALTANSQTGSFEVTAMITDAPSPATFTLTNAAGAANKLAFTQEPANALAGVNISPAVTVQLQDSFGNAVQTSGITITLQLIPAQTLSGATQTTDANGLATFASLNVQHVGQYQLLAEASSIVSAESSAFIISAGAAAIIHATGGTPQSATILTAFAQPLQVTVTDSFGNPVAGTVTFSPPGSGASASVNPPEATIDANGHATTTVTANDAAGSYSVTASIAGVAGTAAFALTNVAGAVGQILFVQQPTNTEAGAVITPAVTVRLLDGAGNPVPGTGVSLEIQGGTAALDGTITATTDATGLATFSGLSIMHVGSYQLQAVSGNISAVSHTFSITVAFASVTIAVFSGNGQSADVGTAYGSPLRASVQDPLGNPLAGASVTFTAPASGASVTFSGSMTVTTDATGLATSPAMTANSQPGSFQVSAATSLAPSPALFSLTNLAASASHLAFIQQPADTLAGAAITPAVTLQLEDASGNAVHTAGVAVSLQSNPVARQSRLLSGATTQNTDANGLATFAGLSIAQTGAYQLLATSSGIASATSNTFNITAGIPAAILPSEGTPQSAIVNTVFGAPLQATVTDASGNPLSGVTVIFAAPVSGASGLFSGQSTVTVTTGNNGHASVVITANGIAGSYVVTASSSAITGSAAFSLTNLPAGSNSLAFVQQPTNTVAGQVVNPPVTVRVQNASGQSVSVAGVPIVLSLSSGAGTLLGTLVQLTNSAGLATFNDLHIAETGTYRLRATANQEVPADSNTFQITAGAAASITVSSGTPQSTTISQPFPASLQAQVKDAAGNPVNGVSVTFSAPSSGPSGTFAGAATVTTGSNGIAIAPALTANSQAGSFTVTAAATGVASPAVFALTNLPLQTGTIMLDMTQLAFTSEIGQPAPAGQIVQITAPVSWTVSSSASWLSASPSSGSSSGHITVSVNPAGLAVGVYTGSLTITGSDGSAAVVFVTYTITGKPALVITPHTLVFSASSNTAMPAAQTLTATSTSRTIAYSVSATVSTPSGGTWLHVSPVQGQTAGSVTVSANPAGLSQGVYDGSVLFTPVESGVNPVAVPVTLIVGCGEGGCVVEPNIITVVNGASFQPGGAPRAIMTIFGTDLSDATYQATSFPLPTQLGPTTVTINGAAVPLYFVSPTQINFQMPSTAPAAGVQAVVTNQAANAPRAISASQPHVSTLSPVNPGLFVTSGDRAAALNGDLSVHTAATPIPAGGYVILFLTGEGPVTPALADGTAAPAAPLSIINGTVQVTIGGQNASVTYQGVAPGFAGLAQLNVIVPAGLTPGDQPVLVAVNGVSSNAGLITVK